MLAGECSTDPGPADIDERKEAADGVRCYAACLGESAPGGGSRDDKRVSMPEEGADAFCRQARGAQARAPGLYTA